jgi:glycosyltransferase involved in cell wall biosynthesis
MKDLIQQIHVLILTKNEAPNLNRVLNQLRVFPRVVVLDSGSTDGTRSIAESFANVEFHVRDFDSFANQCNFALDHLLNPAPWTLSLDADYVLSDALIAELAVLEVGANAGFEAEFVFCMDGHPLPGSFYPPRTVLFQTQLARYLQLGHQHKVQVNGFIDRLSAKIFHDDRKDFAYVIANQKKYAAQEAKYLRSMPFSELRFPSKLRKLGVVMPVLAPMVALLSKCSFLRGRPAWKYAYFRWIAELEIAKAIWRLRMS